MQPRADRLALVRVNGLADRAPKSPAVSIPQLDLAVILQAGQSVAFGRQGGGPEVCPGLAKAERSQTCQRLPRGLGRRRCLSAPAGVAEAAPAASRRLPGWRERTGGPPCFSVCEGSFAEAPRGQVPQPGTEVSARSLPFRFSARCAESEGTQAPSASAGSAFPRACAWGLCSPALAGEATPHKPQAPARGKALPRACAWGLCGVASPRWRLGLVFPGACAGECFPCAGAWGLCLPLFRNFRGEPPFLPLF